MKQIRTIENVLLNAQTHSIGTVVVRMEEFKFLGNTSVVHIGYYQQILSANAEVGAPKYSLVPIPVKDSVVGKTNVKRVTFIKAQLDAIFQATDTSILKTGSFTDQLSTALTRATLLQMIVDENYRKFNAAGVLEVMTVDDWEIVSTQELVTA